MSDNNKKDLYVIVFVRVCLYAVDMVMMFSALLYLLCDIIYGLYAHTHIVIEVKFFQNETGC